MLQIAFSLNVVCLCVLDTCCWFLTWKFFFNSFSRFWRSISSFFSCSRCFFASFLFIFSAFTRFTSMWSLLRYSWHRPCKTLPYIIWITTDQTKWTHLLSHIFWYMHLHQHLHMYHYLDLSCRISHGPLLHILAISFFKMKHKMLKQKQKTFHGNTEFLKWRKAELPA